jgi:hypothetical protein
VRKRQPALIAVGAIWLLFSTVVCAAVLNSYALQRRAAREYRPVTAIVMSSKVRRSTGAPKSQMSYSVDVVYRYNVGGVSYSSSQYRYLGRGLGYRGVVDEVARLPRGREVTAFYDPRDPARAVLDNAPPRRQFLLFIILLFEGLGIAMIVYGITGTKVPPAVST